MCSRNSEVVWFTYMCSGAGVPPDKHTHTHTVWTGVMWNSDPVFETCRTSERGPEKLGRGGGGGLDLYRAMFLSYGLYFSMKKVNRLVLAAYIYQWQTHVGVSVAGSWSCMSLINTDNKNWGELLMLRKHSKAISKGSTKPHSNHFTWSNTCR